MQSGGQNREDRRDDREGRKKQVIVPRSFAFSLSAITFAKEIPQTPEGLILRRQLLRSALSIGANVEEAQSADTKRDFTYRMGVALREARETAYWLRLVDAAGLTTRRGAAEPLLDEIQHIVRILGAIVASARGTRKRAT